MLPRANAGIQAGKALPSHQKTLNKLVLLSKRTAHAVLFDL